MRHYLTLCATFVFILTSLSAIAEPINYTEKLSINSEIFGEQRSIRVSLPESYEPDKNRVYPLIVVARGQLDLLVTIASLDLLSNEVPEFIVIGVDGTGGEFHPSKDSRPTKFSRFLHDEVLPYVEENYSAAPYRVLLGHSNAGRFVANNWLEDGQTFANYIAISPSFEDGHISAQSKALAESELAKKNSMLFTVASENKSMQEPFTELEELFSKQESVSFARFPKQTHMSTRANAIMHGLRAAFSNWEPPKKTQRGDLDGLKRHYKDLTKRFGFEVGIPLDMLTRIAGFESWSDDPKKNENAARVVKYALTKQPENADAFFETATQLIDYGAEQGSERLLSYICRTVKNDKRCSAK